MYMRTKKLKSVALPVPEIGVAQKICTVPAYAHTPYSKKSYKMVT